MSSDLLIYEQTGEQRFLVDARDGANDAALPGFFVVSKPHVNAG
jgi:hypothetical protein